MSNDLNLVNNGRMYRENSLNAAAVSYTSNGKGLLDAAVSLSDNGALENLDSVLLAFLDSYVYLYSSKAGTSLFMLDSLISFNASILISS